MPRASRFALIVLILASFTGCATAQALRAGRDAEFLQEYDRAIVEYTRALQEDPDNKDARQGLERAKIRASLEHFLRGRRLAQAGRLKEAAVELQIAAELNPGNADIRDLLTAVRTQLQTQIVVSRGGKTELESLVERIRTMPPPGLDLPDAEMPDTLMWSGSVRDLYLQLGKIANISVAFDPQFQDRTINIDLRNQTLEQALTAVSKSTRNFYQVTAPGTITVIPDTPAKRTEYETEIVQVIPLSNVDPKEVTDLLRIVIDNRRIQPFGANNMIAIKDTPERVRAAMRLAAALDKARPEVVIDVEILEVDRSKLQEYGLQIASAGDALGLNGAITIERDDLSAADLDTLSASDVFLSPLPGLFYRLLKQDSNTRTLANTQLRVSDGRSGQAQFGERVPVPVTTFAPIATGGVAQQPITSFNYEHIGVNIEITPRAHHNDDVTMELELEVSSLTGTGFGGLPTFGTRRIATINRLHDGETNLLAGLIRDEDRRVKSGIPGLSDIPAIGSIFARNRQETQETDVVITLTPHIIRVLEVTEADLLAFQVGEGGSGTTGLDLIVPIPGSVPPAVDGVDDPFRPAPPEDAVPPAQPGPARPIFPPAPPPVTPPQPER